jgi:hypothetical protein
MSEHRKPIEFWSKSLPQKQGTKKRKKRLFEIELVPAFLWRGLWEPRSKLFIPQVPLRHEDMTEYWTTRFRIRVKGRWVGPAGRLKMFTKQQIRERYFR